MTRSPRNQARPTARAERRPLLRTPRARGEILVFVVAVLCFATVPLFNGYCYDSVEIVQQNPLVQDGGRWLDIWTTDYWWQGSGEAANRDLLYRPAAMLSFRMVRTVAGEAAWPQHLVNVLLHGLVSLLVVRFGLAVGLSRGISVAGGLLFAVLPIHVEVVADVVGRSELLATVGVLLALLWHEASLRAADVSRASLSGETFPRPLSAREGGKRAWGSHVWVYRVAALAAVFLALTGKESGVGVVLLLPLMDLLWHARRKPSPPVGVGADGHGQSAPAWLGVSTVRRLSIYVIPAAIYVGLRYHALGGQLTAETSVSKTVNLLIDAPGWQRGLGALQLWGLYWCKTFWPQTLTIDYGLGVLRLPRSVADPLVLLGLAVAVAMLAGGVWAVRRRRFGVLFLLLGVVVAYAPTSNAIVLIQTYFAERIWYLPSVFVALLTVVVLSHLLKRTELRPLFIVVLVGLTVRCWVRALQWQDNGVLFASAHQANPDGVAGRLLYGGWLIDHGRTDACQQGIALLEEAVTADMGLTDGHRLLGRAYAKIGDWPNALHQLQIAEQQHSTAAIAALLAKVRGRVAVQANAALEKLRGAADAKPADLDAELAYLQVLLDTAAVDKTLARLQAREDTFAPASAWQRQYATALLLAGRRDDAIARYRRALSLQPDNPQTKIELASLLFERRDGGDLAEVDQLTSQVNRDAPEALGAWVLRAELLALRGGIDQALQIYDRIIAQLPADSEQRRLWEGRAKALGQP